MTATTSSLRDVCRLLGGLTLEGARSGLLRELRQQGAVAKLGAAVGGPLGEALATMQSALEREDADALAAEYTRLMVANADRGARSPLPVPPWEDCYTGEGRKVLGARSRAALQAYAAAALGFEGMKEQPADHVGLELCFVAALLDEEEKGERDASVREAFVSEHLTSFSPALGRTLADATRTSFWRETGRALGLLPGLLTSSAVERPGCNRHTEEGPA